MADEHPEDFELLEVPRDGVPSVVDDDESLQRAVQALSEGSGPVAVDAERASGYRYGQRAYLVQLRRAGSGTWLIDPVGFEDLMAVDAALADTEWVLHAATQDIPCLAEVGMHPRALFDTELGARLAGLPRVGLSAVMEYYLGISLAKEHSAVDWSTRPLPEPWLHYASLDVELLVELRNRMDRDLAEQGKQDWAAQEFAALTEFTAPGREDAWRRTAGMHRLRGRRPVAVLRELWLTRDAIAQERDVASGRVLPDATLVDLAARAPTTATELGQARAEKTRSRQRRAEQGLVRHQASWLDAIRAGLDLPEADLPPAVVRTDAPPPARAWADRDPEAAARLAQVRDGLAALSDHYDVPVENIATPDLVRRMLWRPPTGPGGEAADEATVRAALAERGARPWQQDLVVPLITASLATSPPPA